MSQLGSIVWGTADTLRGRYKASQDGNTNAFGASQGSSLRARHFSVLSGSTPIYLSLVGQGDQGS